MYPVPNRMLAMLEQNRMPVGMQVFSGNHSIIEILGVTGFDYAWLDTEHSPIDPRSLEDTIRVAENAGLFSLVRLPEPDDYTAARRALEAGAEGVIVPMVRSGEDITGVIDALIYPPEGKRGLCPAYRAAGYSLRTFQDYQKWNTENLLIIPMIETVEALEHIEEICAFDEVRVIVFAAGELALALGEGTRMHSSEKVREWHAKVKDVARRHGVALMGGPILDPSPESCAKAIDDGISVFVLGIDLMTFRRSCESIIDAANVGVQNTRFTRPPAPASGFPDHL